MSQANNLDLEPWRGGPGESIRAYLHSHSTKDFNELYRKDEEFREYAKDVYKYLDHMSAGDRIYLKYTGEELEWVLLTIIAFYQEPYHSLDFYMSDDYTYFYRDYISPSAREYAIRCFKEADEKKRKAAEAAKGQEENLQPAA